MGVDQDRLFIHTGAMEPIKPARLHVSIFTRHIWREPVLLVVRGNFAEVLTCRDLYHQRHNIPPADSEGRLEQLMAAAGLAAVSLADRESWGWSLTLEGSAAGMFCGVEPEGMVCGLQREAPGDRVAGALQRQKGDGPLVQSAFEPRGDCPVAAVEQYFGVVEQIPTRLVVSGDWECALVQTLPGGDLATVQGLDDAQLLQQLQDSADAGELGEAGEVVLFYDCRCDDEMILQMITSLPAPQRAELWGEDPQIEVVCPRCGRTYAVQRPFK